MLGIVSLEQFGFFLSSSKRKPLAGFFKNNTNNFTYRV